MDKRNEVNFNLDRKYQDLEGLTEKRLDWGLWFVERRRKFKIASVVILILVSALSWGLTLYSFVYYIFQGMNQDEAVVRQLVRAGAAVHDYVVATAPVDLTYYPVNIFNSGDKKYDFIAQVANLNKRHWGELEYTFVVNGQELPSQEGFILPEETKYFMALGQNSESIPYGAQFVVKKLAWHRIDAHQIPDWESFKAKHENITIQDIQTLPGSSQAPGKVNLGEVDFTAINQTAYNYADTDFVILLYSGSNLIGANRYQVDEFDSGEEKKIVLGWPDIPSGVSETRVIPEVNYMLADSYLKYRGEAGSDGAQ